MPAIETPKSGETFTNDYKEAKRKIDQNNAASSDDSVEFLEPSTSGGIPMQMKKMSTKRFALSTSPLTSMTTTTTDTKLTVTLSSLEEAINKASSTKTVQNSSETICLEPNLPGFSTFLAGPLSSYRAKSESILNKRVITDDANLPTSTSTSQILTIADRRRTNRSVERPPVCMASKHINYQSLRPVIIDGSNVAMQ